MSYDHPPTTDPDSIEGVPSSSPSSPPPLPLPAVADVGDVPSPGSPPLAAPEAAVAIVPMSFAQKIVHRVDLVDNALRRVLHSVTLPLLPWINLIIQSAVWQRCSQLLTEWCAVATWHWADLANWVVVLWYWFYTRVPLRIAAFYRWLWRVKLTWMCAVLAPTFLAATVALSRDWLAEREYSLPLLKNLLDCAYYGCIGITTTAALPIVVPLAVPVVLYTKFHLVLAMFRFWALAFVSLLRQLLGAWIDVVLNQVLPDVWRASLLLAKCCVFVWKLAQTFLFAIVYVLAAVWVAVGQACAVVVGVTWTVIVQLTAAFTMPFQLAARAVE